MAGPLNVSMLLTADASGMKRGIDEARRGVEGLGVSARTSATGLGALAAANDQAAAAAQRAAQAAIGQSQAETQLQRTINAAVGVRAESSGSDYARRQADIEAFGASLDQLRAKYNPVYAASQAYERELTELNRALSLGAINAQEHGAALTQLNGRYTAAAGAAAVYGESAGLARMQTANLAFQFQDIGTMLASGQNPFILLAQQLPQVTMYGGRLDGVMAALKGTVAGLFSPLGLMTTGFVLAGSAAISAFSSTEDASKKVEDALERQRDLLNELEGDWERVGRAASGAFSETTAGYASRISRSIAELRLQLADDANSVSGQIGRYGTNPYLDSFNGEIIIQDTFIAKFSEFQEEIERLNTSVVNGKPNFVEFRNAITERWELEPNNAALRAQATELLKLTERSNELEIALRRLVLAQQEFGANTRGGRLFAGGSWARDDMADLSAFEQSEAIASERRRAGFSAEVMGIYARSPGQQAAAASASAAASYNDNETPQARAERIELAGKRALIQAEYQLSEAQRERLRSLEQSVASQELEVSLIGKTAGEVAQLRTEFELTARLREEAARNGIAVDQAEIELIRQKAAEIGKLAQVQASAALMNDLAFERSQFGRSANDQQIASRLRGSGLAVDLDSPEARAIRENMSFETIRSDVSSFMNDFRTALQNNGGDLGEALSTSVSNAAMRAFDRTMEELIASLSSSIAEALSAQSGIGGGGGGLFGAIGKLLGGTALSSTATAAISSGSAHTYSSGGFTGWGNPGRVAGMVHEEEYVVSAPAVRTIGLGNLERMHQRAKAGRGFAEGGYTGGGSGMMVDAGGGRVHLTFGLASDGALNIMPEVRQVSRGEATGVLYESGPQLVNAATQSTMASIARGDADDTMSSRFGVEARARRLG